MDAASRDRAQRRRAMLALRQQRKAESAEARRLGALLCDQGIRWVRVPPPQVRALLGTKLAAPAIDERFDWQRIPGATIRHWQSSDEARQLVAAALEHFAAPDERITMVFHTHESGLRLKAMDLAANLASILPALREFWLAGEDQPWLIDYNAADRELCFCAAMPGC
ncbi:hypothetical protein [Novosphingobium sp. TH158]|uniref:hypothetical protein n=1 Tax=Novosphingobium sp. TH158 TaxID=2067455 RepID=UPI000C7CC5F4|nr:hypothetical protein [Novosphingobium sp. TH158]PLK24299.1 hypothetical protein C0V78_13610 [Novosphingobium sp. TH158]